MGLRKAAVDLRRFVRALGLRFSEDGGFSLCGSLAFTSLLSLVPVVTVALTVFSALPMYQRVQEGARRFLADNLLPDHISRSLIDHVEGFVSGAAGLTPIGLASIAATAFVLVSTIERAFDRIWRVPRRRSVGARVLMYWTVMTLGPVLVGASLAMTAFVLQESRGYTQGIPYLPDALGALAPVALMTVTFAMVYVVVPNTSVALRHALVGGASAAILFDLGNRALALYVVHWSNYALVYGAFSVLPVFLGWLYMAWMVAILGAEITALLPRYPLEVVEGAAGRVATLL